MFAYVQLIHFAVQQKLTQHCKATVLQKKFFLSLKSQFNHLQHVILILDTDAKQRGKDYWNLKTN